MPLTEPDIECVVSQYQLQRARFEEVALLVEMLLRRQLSARTIRVLTTSRAKAPKGLREKLRTKRSKYDLDPLMEKLDHQITDLAGCRVLLYDPADRDAVVRLVRSTFPLADLPNADEPHAKPSGYRAHHLLVRVHEDHERESLSNAVCEVQVASLAEHVYNELEHDVRYKTGGVVVSDPEETALKELRAASEMLDACARRTNAAHSSSIAAQTIAIESPDRLQHLLEQRVGRKLEGEFERLHTFLEMLLEPYTAAAVISLGSPQDLLAAGNQRIKSTSGSPDDASAFLIGIGDQIETEALSFVGHIRGRPSAFRRNIEAAFATGGPT